MFSILSYIGLNYIIMIFRFDEDLTILLEENKVNDDREPKLVNVIWY